MKGSTVQPLKRKERRKHPRKPCCLVADGLTLGSVFKAISKDISLGGVFVITPRSYAVNEDIFLKFHVDPLQKEPITVAGKIVWNSPSGLGVELTDVPERLPNIIEALT